MKLSPAKRLLRQPLFWFALGAALLFTLDSQRPQDERTIHVSLAQQQRLATLWQTQTGQPPSAAELDALTENWIREELLYREALRLGLDRDDSIIRRRLVQKLGFIAESEQDPAAADETALREFYRANPGDYTLPLRYSFGQQYFDSLAEAEAVLQRHRAGDAIESAGQTSMLNPTYAWRSEVELSAIFGSGFAQQLAGLSTGEWDGPVRSSFGYHLIELHAVHAEEVSPFGSIRQQVLQDYGYWLQEQARESYIDGLQDEYTIVREAP